MVVKGVEASDFHSLKWFRMREQNRAPRVVHLFAVQFVNFSF